MKLNYVIAFVGDMDRAVKFWRDVLGLPLKFESPAWSEFATGETTLAFTQLLKTILLELYNLASLFPIFKNSMR